MEVKFIDAANSSKELLEKLSLGSMQGVAYDTAWVARIENTNGKPMFPKTLKWILDNQMKDGSWGAQIEYYHDRIISTTASILALSQYDKKKYSQKIKSGENYIWNNIDNLKKDAYETVGFELIFPTLMEEGKKKKLNLPYHKSHYDAVRERKLKSIPEEYIYSKKTAIGHSIEFLGDDVDINKIVNVQLEDGSVFNSPSATAYLLRHVSESECSKKAYNYINNVLSLNNGVSPIAFPFELLETSFVLNNFLFSDMPLDKLQLNEAFKKCAEMLKNSWCNTGIAFSSTFPVPDLDDTAVAFKILHFAKENANPEVFEHFETPDHFVCYPFELNSSVGANIHALDAIKYCSSYKRRDEVIEKILKFLKNAMIQNSYWVDKWVASPYYATAHAVMAISTLDKELVGKSIDWMLNNQNQNGSWGSNGGTAEETAYALLALIHYHKYIENLDVNLLIIAGEYLEKKLINVRYPELWIDKGLYAPTNIIESAMLSAYYAYKANI